MTRFTRTLGLLAALFGTTTAARADEKAAAFDDAKFVQLAASGGMLEVELGRIGMAAGKSDGVRKFGATLVNDHTKANEQLRKVAKEAGFPVPDKMLPDHQQTFEKFRDYKGNDFDRDYVACMVEDHEKDVALFQKAAKESKNEAVRTFASATLPTLENHLAMAKKLRDGK